MWKYDALTNVNTVTTCNAHSASEISNQKAAHSSRFDTQRTIPPFYTTVQWVHILSQKTSPEISVFNISLCNDEDGTTLIIIVLTNVDKT